MSEKYIKATSTKTRFAIFTEGVIWKSLVKFAIPMFLGNILQQLYSITDAIVVGQILGPNALAAVGASTPINRLSISLAIGMTLGASVLVAQYLGAVNCRKVRAVISTCQVFFAVLAICIMIPGMLFSRPLLEAFNTPPEVMEGAVSYMRITFAGVCPVIGFNVMASISRGFGNSRIPLLMLVISALLNIALDLLAIKVLGMGVAGAAWATVVSQLIACLMAERMLRRAYAEYHEPWAKKRIDRQILIECLRIGVPSGIKGTTYWGGVALLTGMVNTYGASATAAFSIASRIDSFLQTPLVSLQTSLTAFTAQNKGAGKYERIKTGARVSMGIGIAFALIVTGALYFTAPLCVRAFTNDVAVVEIGVQYLRIVSVFYIIYALQEVIQGVAVGCSDTWVLLLSTIVAMWVFRVPLAYLLSDRLGLTGIWLSMPSGWFIAMLFSQGYYLSGKWKHRSISKERV